MKRTKILTLFTALSITTIMITGCGKVETVDGSANDAGAIFAENKSNETVDFDETNESVETVGPAEITEHTETVESAEMSEPTETADQTETSAPEVTTKPSATTKPSETAASAETSMPDATTKPAATAKPANTEKPAEPEVAAKPEVTETSQDQNVPQNPGNSASSAVDPSASAQPSTTTPETPNPETPATSEASSCNHIFTVQIITEVFPENCTGRSRCVDMCSKCGYIGKTYDDTGIEEAHAWYKPIIASYPTCVSPGEQYHVCERCGKEGPHLSMPINENNHDYVKTSETIMGNCYCNNNIQLIVTYTCSLCGNTKDQVEAGPRGDHLDRDGNGICDLCGTVCGEPVQQPDPTPEPAPEQPAPDPVPEPVPEQQPVDEMQSGME